MKPRPTPRGSVSISFVTYYDNGTESRCRVLAPYDEATCQRIVSTRVAGLFKAPVDERSTPGSLVPTSPPIPKIECSLEILKYPPAMDDPLDLLDTEFILGND